MMRNGTDADIRRRYGITTEEELALQKGKVAGGLSTYRTSVLFFHLVEKQLDSVIGSFSFHNWYPAHRRSEIGYAVTERALMSKGYMREAIGPIIAFGFEAMGLNRIEAFIHPDNEPSRKLVMRAGFQQEGWLHEHYCKDGITGDSLVYGLLARDYRGRAQAANG